MADPELEQLRRALAEQQEKAAQAAKAAQELTAQNEVLRSELKEREEKQMIKAVSSRRVSFRGLEAEGEDPVAPEALAAGRSPERRLGERLGERLGCGGAEGLRPAEGVQTPSPARAQLPLQGVAREGSGRSRVESGNSEVEAFRTRSERWLRTAARNDLEEMRRCLAGLGELFDEASPRVLGAAGSHGGEAALQEASYRALTPRFEGMRTQCQFYRMTPAARSRAASDDEIVARLQVEAEELRMECSDSKALAEKLREDLQEQRAQAEEANRLYSNLWRHKEESRKSLILAHETIEALVRERDLRERLLQPHPRLQDESRMLAMASMGSSRSQRSGSEAPACLPSMSTASTVVCRDEAVQAPATCVPIPKMSPASTGVSQDKLAQERQDRWGEAYSFSQPEAPEAGPSLLCPPPSPWLGPTFGPGPAPAPGFLGPPSTAECAAREASGAGEADPLLTMYTVLREQSYEAEQDQCKAHDHALYAEQELVAAEPSFWASIVGAAASFVCCSKDPSARLRNSASGALLAAQPSLSD